MVERYFEVCGSLRSNNRFAASPARAYRMIAFLLALSLVVLGHLGTALAAEGGGVGVDNLYPRGHEDEYIRVEGGRIPTHMTIGFLGYLSMASFPYDVTRVNSDGSPVSDRKHAFMQTGYFQATLGLYDEVRVGLGIPWHRVTVEQPAVLGGGTIQKENIPAGINASVVYGKNVSPNPWVPRIFLGMDINVARNANDGLDIRNGQDERVFEFYGGARETISIVDFAGQIGTAIRIGSSTERLGAADFTYGLAAKVNTRPPAARKKLMWLGLIAELNGAFSLIDPEYAPYQPLELDMAMRVHTSGGVNASTGIGVGLNTDHGSPTARIFFLLGYDLITDDDPDSDKDGIIRALDSCPYDAEDFDQFEDEDGCPEPDNDEDGVLDAADQCGFEKEDMDGFKDEDGCPDLDNDEDGNPDVTDQCPLDPEDLDAFEDEDGCPEPDNDKDGFADAVDKCPLRAETVNGIEDEDGCPETSTFMLQVRLHNAENKAAIDGSLIQLPERTAHRSINSVIRLDLERANPFYNFEVTAPDFYPASFSVPTPSDGSSVAGDIGLRPVPKPVQEPVKLDTDPIFYDPGKAVILEKSFPTLVKIVKYLVENPTFSIRIEGHTDSSGPAEPNRQLSQERADAAKTFIVKYGIAEQRIESIGYGEERPIASNQTPEGREKNRRVDFFVWEAGAEPAPQSEQIGGSTGEAEDVPADEPGAESGSLLE